MKKILYDEFGYVGIETKSKCTCTHKWLVASGFKARDINGHHPRCKVTKLRLKPAHTTSRNYDLNQRIGGRRMSHNHNWQAVSDAWEHCMGCDKWRSR